MKRKEMNLLVVDEINGQIIKHLTGILYNFCFGAYKEEKKYPKAVANVQFETSEGKMDFEIRARLNKNNEGILERVQFIVINRNKQKRILNN